MICRLCLKDITEVIHIFDVVGLELNVAMVLGKYFWFEPKNDDPISTAICNECWIKVSNFHQFYLSVEEAHRLLTQRFSIKTESRTTRERLSRDNDDNLSVKPSKREPIDEEVHSDEVEMEFSVLLDGEENNDDDDVSDVEQKEPLDSACENKEKKKASVQYKKFIIQDETSFDEEYFVEKILDQAQRLNVEEEEDKLIIKEEFLETTELRRSTRHSRAKTNEANQLTQPSRRSIRRVDRYKNTNTDESDDENETKPNADSMLPKKGKGRPRKATADDVENKCRSKTPTAARLALERKYQANDDKISSYMRLLCQICAEEVPTFAKLRHHFAQVHQETAYVICCNKKFYKRVLLVEHIDRHLDPECYKCVDCNKVFAEKQCLRNHMWLKHQPDEVKTFECEHCPKKFAKSYLLEQHLVVHADREHICEVCNKGFRSASFLSAHIKLKHSNGYGTMCHICAKLIRGRAAFERHQLEHAGVNEPKVQCEKCGSWHKNKYSLQKHMRRHNEEGTLHVCNICSKVAPNRSALLSHFRYVHSSERNYECGVCKKAFKKPINLKEHMTMHTGEVLYSCPYCPKTFNSNANMHSHRKKMHPREFEEQRKQRRGMTRAEAMQQQEQTLYAEETNNIKDATATNDAEAVDGDSIMFTAS